MASPRRSMRGATQRKSPAKSSPHKSPVKRKAALRGGGAVDDDPTSAAYWTADNALRASQGFNWGSVDVKLLLQLIEDAAMPERRDGRPLRMMIAGAGTSTEPRALQDALGSKVQVVCVDFDPAAVAWQAARGVQARVLDLVNSFDASLRHSFDVVYDASFVDVFMSTWIDKSVDVQFDNPSAARALRNLVEYLTPGGLLVVKSIIASAEEYDLLWRVALERFSPSRAMAMARAAKRGGELLHDEGTYRQHLLYEAGASEVRNTAYARAQRYTTRAGRLTDGREGLGFTGHLGAWRNLNGDTRGVYVRHA